MPVVEIETLDQWNQIIGSNTTVVVDFYASWCGPCRAIAPKFAAMSDKDSMADVVFAKVDTQNEDLESVTAQFEVHAIPTIIVFKNGKLMHKTVGANLAQVESAINFG